MKRGRDALENAAPVDQPNGTTLSEGPHSAPSQGTLRDVALLSLRLGCTAFGGPAAHIAMLRDEVVVRRRWLSELRFLDLLGATNLIPGPNSTEMVIHTGYTVAGWRGLILGGTLFILPAALITLVFAWLYVAYGTTPAGEWLLYGVKPVVLAVVVQAIWGLGRTAFRTPALLALGVAALALALLGVNEIVVLLGLGGAVALGRGWRPGTRAAIDPIAFAGAAAGVGSVIAWLGGVARSRAEMLTWVGGLVPLLAVAASAGYSPLVLFLQFLKIGATLYGSGYVLLAFLEGDFVDGLGWITGQQLLDAVAVGQFTPGPVFTTATFVGYLVGGWGGAILATLGIFLPGFVFVALTHRLVARLRESRWAGGFLDGVNAAAIGLMAAVLLFLGRDALVDWRSVLLAVAAAVLLIRFRVNSAALILGGAAVGLLVYAVGGGAT